MVNILKWLLRLYDAFVRLVLEPAQVHFGRMYLRARGVELGGGVLVYGLPLVTIAKGARIVIGHKVTLRSKSRGNAVGVSHPVILRAMAPGALISIGSGTGISGGAVCAVARVELGVGVLVGADVIIADNDFHGLDPAKRRIASTELVAEPVAVGDNVWVGARAYIGKGVKIGKNSVIGAGAIVTKDIPPNQVAAGVPARVIRALGADESIGYLEGPVGESELP